MAKLIQKTGITETFMIKQESKNLNRRCLEKLLIFRGPLVGKELDNTYIEKRESSTRA